MSSFTICQYIVTQRQICLHLQWCLQQIVDEYILFHLTKWIQQSQSVNPKGSVAQFANDVMFDDDRAFLGELSMLYGQTIVCIGTTFLEPVRQWQYGFHLRSKWTGR